MINNNQKEKGFTMIEMLASLAIFGFVSVLLVNIFVSALSSQKRILQNQELMNQSSYTLEYMTKAIRMAERDMTGECIDVGDGDAGENYGIGTSPVALTFLTYDIKASANKCIQFLFENNAIEERISTDDTSDNLGAPVSITSSSVSVERLEFYVTGDTVGDMIQPRVSVMIKMKALPAATNSPIIIVETSVSQRKFDI